MCAAGRQVGTQLAPTPCHFDVIPVMPPSGEVETLAEAGAIRASGIRSEAWDRQVPMARVELEGAGIGVPGLQPHLGVAKLTCDRLEVSENRMADAVRAGTSVHALQLTDVGMLRVERPNRTATERPPRIIALPRDDKRASRTVRVLRRVARGGEAAGDARELSRELADQCAGVGMVGVSRLDDDASHGRLGA